jgi:hypothetical protein
VAFRRSQELFEADQARRSNIGNRNSWTDAMARRNSELDSIAALARLSVTAITGEM